MKQYSTVGESPSLMRRIVRPQSYLGLMHKPIDALKWRQVDARIKQQMAEVACIQVLQVGANDGSHSDPINRYIIDHNWSGVLVEPVPEQYARLQDTYSRNSRLQLVNAAVSDQDGLIEMYTPKDAKGPLKGKDSMHLDVIAKHGWMTDGNIEDHLNKIEVPSVTLQSLAEQTGLRLTDIDMLVVDTEGHDKVVLDQVDFEGEERPPLVMYEHCHLSRLDDTTVRRRLSQAGYRLITLRRDVFAHQPA